MIQLNTFADISSIAQAVQHDANFVLREMAFIDRLILNLSDRTGGNTRTRYDYSSVTMNDIGESDDLTSQAFTPSAGVTLTPAEIGAQFFITDKRAASDAPENILTDAATELGMAGADAVSQDIYGLFSSLTGGTVGASGSAMTWGLLSAAITQARVSIKNAAIPLVAVMHSYQWHVLAKAASIAGSSLAQAPRFTDEVTANWYVGNYAGCAIFVSPAMPLSSTDCYAGVFAKEAMAIDWRKAPGVEAERDASRRGVELNYTAMYAKGVWRPTFGVQLITTCTAPTS